MRLFTAGLAALLIFGVTLTLPASAAPTATGAAKPLTPLARLRNATSFAAIKQLKPQRDGSFSFIVAGDNRNGDETFKRLVAKMNDYAAGKDGPGVTDRSYRPLFLVHTGDIVPSGTMAEWDNFGSMRAALTIPAVFVPGNHEMRTADGPGLFQTIVGSGDWSFDFGGCRFIGLDDSLGTFSAESVAYLRQQLGLDAAKSSGATDVKSRSRYDRQGGALPSPLRHFVAFHEPPYWGRWTVHSTKSDADGGRSSELMAACKAARVDAVLMGHIHMYDYEDIDGVPYIISAGGGAPLYNLGFGKAEYGFTLVHVGPKGVSWDWVPLDAQPPVVPPTQLRPAPKPQVQH